MIKQTILWTTLPNGSDGLLSNGTKLKLSVFISPRLWNNDPSVTSMQLSQFPDFLDWPAKVNAATFKVQFEGGPTLDAVRVSDPASTELWQALFKPTTLVKPYAFEDLTGAEIISFPSQTILDVLQNVYQRAAIDPAYGAGNEIPGRIVWETDPDITEIAPATRPADPKQPDAKPKEDEKPGKGCCLFAFWYKFLDWLKAKGILKDANALLRPEDPVFKPDNGGGGVVTAVSPKKAAFDSMQEFVYMPYNVKDAADLPTQPEIDQQYDFHAMVSALGEYPQLLRKMGLVVDLSVTIGAAIPPASSRVKLSPSIILGTTTTPYTPRTNYEAGNETFRAKPKSGSDMSAGLLRLEDANLFKIVQTDVTGSGIKLRNMATSLRGFKDHTPVPANRPNDEGLPALRTAGLSIIRPELPVRLMNRFKQAYALNAALAVVDGSPLKPAAGGSTPPATDELFADDLVRGYRIDVFDDQSNLWHSLCQRVGNYTFLDMVGPPLTLEDEGYVQIGVTEELNPAPGNRKLKAHESLFTWDGWSLCAPRPGKTILPDDSVGDTTNAPATPFRMQTDFKAKPGSLPRLRFGFNYRLRARMVDLAGNSVINPPDSEFQQTQTQVTPQINFRRYEPVNAPPMMLKALPKEGESLENLVVRSQFDKLPLDVGEIQTERHIAPPKISQLLAEFLQRFDGSAGMKKDTAGYSLAAREAGTLTHRWDTTTESAVIIAGAQEVVTPEHTFWLQTNDTFDIAYLPDLYARGVLLLGLPGMSAFDTIIEPNGQVVNKIPFEGTWPDRKPLRLRLVGIPENQAPAQPLWNAGQRLLIVEIPQGHVNPVRISSYLHPADLNQQAVWDWVVQANPANLPQLRQQTEAGRSWLQMPYRELKLIHAVQQPLDIPQLVNLRVQTTNTLPPKYMRAIGDTTVPLVGKMKVDAKSTGKVDLHADWEDPFDDLEKDTYQPGVDIIKSAMVVGDIPILDPAQDQVQIKPLIHAIGDTKYHKVNYNIVATTRFREFFPIDDPLISANLVRPTQAEAGTPAADVTKDEVDIPNAARPGTLQLESVFPTFHWREDRNPTMIIRERRGGGLRVYLHRPWYSSGDGELLGVLLRPTSIPPNSPLMNTLKKYVSEWGMDPIWDSVLTAPMTQGDFNNPLKTEKGLSIAELDSVHLDVVGYKPQFDPQSKLWFCDVYIDPQETYFPFVRLALARYQPISVDNAHLSPVVQSDFCQVVPHRLLEYDLGDLETKNKIYIRMRGPAYYHPQYEYRGSPIVQAAALKRPQPGAKGDLDWVVIPKSDVVLTPVQQTREETIWEGVMTIAPPIEKPMRLVVIEYELFFQASQAEGWIYESAVNLANSFSSEASPSGGMVITPTVPGGVRLTFFDAVTVE